jgi:hypothetical protein
VRQREGSREGERSTTPHHRAESWRTRCRYKIEERSCAAVAGVGASRIGLGS